jgi:YgiT-type zinc finger domain-containing protein
MKCRISGCPGDYVQRRILHAVRNRGEVVVFDGVPAEVCDRCGDTLFAPETVRRLEELAKSNIPPQDYAPIFQF